MYRLGSANQHVRPSRSRLRMSRIAAAGTIRSLTSIQGSLPVACSRCYHRRHLSLRVQASSTAQLTAPAAPATVATHVVESHVLVPAGAVPVTTAPAEHASSSGSSSQRSWAGRKKQAEAVTEINAPIVQLRPRQLRHLQQDLLQHQQQKQEAGGMVVLLQVVPVVLLAGAAAAAGHLWRRQQRSQANGGQQQEQKQQQWHQDMTPPQVMRLMVATLQSAAAELVSTAKQSVAQLAGSASGTAAGQQQLQQQQQSKVAESATIQQQQQLPQGWWLSLEKVYYLNFGSHAGLLPRVDLPAATSSIKQHLIAFESKADAEYACNVIQATLAAASRVQTPANARKVFRGTVVQAKPWYLDDLAGVQRIGLDVLPRGKLQLSANMSGPQLEEFLVQHFSSHTAAAAATTPAEESTQAPFVEDQTTMSSNQQQQQRQQEEAEEAAATAASKVSSGSSSGFVPVSTDIPLFDFDGDSDRTVVQLSGGSTRAALSDLMAAGMAAVPVSFGKSSSSSTHHQQQRDARRPLEQQQQQQQDDDDQRVKSILQKAAEAATSCLPRDSIPSSSSSSSSSAVDTDAAAAGQQALAGAVVTHEADQQQQQQQEQQLEYQQSQQQQVEVSVTAEAAAVDTTHGDATHLDQADASLDDVTDVAELNDDDLMAEYHKLKQQQPGVDAARLEAAYDSLVRDGSVAVEDDDDGIDMPSPTAIAAAAAADGIAVNEGFIADAVAAKFFTRGSSSSSSSLGEEATKSRHAASPGSSSSRRVFNEKSSVAEASAAAGVLDSMQEQLRQLQQQADTLLQQQQQQQGSGAQALDGQLQSLMNGIDQVQQQMQQVAATTAGGAGTPHKQHSSSTSRPAVTDQQQIRSSSSSSSSGSQQRHAAPVIQAEFQAAASSRSSGRSSMNPPAAPTAPAGNNHPRSAGNPAADTGSSSSNRSSSSGGSSSGHRSWGAWGTNRRIKEANVSLLKCDDGDISPAQPQQHQQAISDGSGKGPSSSRPSAAAVAAAAHEEKGDEGVTEVAIGDGAVVTEDGVKIFSRKFGRKRPKKEAVDPYERQALVKDALRVAAQQMTGEPDTEENSNSTTSSSSSSSSNNSSSSGQGQQWWQDKYQAVYLPSIRHADGAVGFVQMDISLNTNSRDVRVLTFEDRHDCMKCLTVLRQWPQMAGAQLTMGAMPSNVAEQEIRDSYQQQLAATGGDASAVGGISPPNGIVVFRRGKLPLRVGMNEEEFTQVVVYQAAAQLALSTMGYKFDD